jgi:hypothetical protein
MRFVSKKANSRSIEPKRSLKMSVEATRGMIPQSLSAVSAPSIRIFDAGTIIGAQASPFCISAQRSYLAVLRVIRITTPMNGFSRLPDYQSERDGAGCAQRLARHLRAQCSDFVRSQRPGCADSHANMDALATTHIASAHVETEPSHSLGVALDLSHLALHM